VRPLALNLATCSATLVLLALLALPAWTLHTGADVSPRGQAPSPGRLFGVYTDPRDLARWSRDVGLRPNLVGEFEAFSRRRAPDQFLHRAARAGVTRAMITWEPWKTVPAVLGPQRQAKAQPGFTNADIAGGSQDGYIARFARSVAAFHGIVYVRYAHEMNGFWYPWSTNPRAYVRAWRRIVGIFRSQGARNARFVWSTNPNLYETRRVWLDNLRRYWPGSRWVDVIGSTMINFGGDKPYGVARFTPALTLLHRTFRKPVFLTELNTEHATRIAWLHDLATELRRDPWIRAVAWSQLPSRAQAHGTNSGADLNWDVTSDHAAAAQLRAVAGDGSG
jgi:mannan endo-1,4-beta-mannosidase